MSQHSINDSQNCSRHLAFFTFVGISVFKGRPLPLPGHYEKSLIKCQNMTMGVNGQSSIEVPDYYGVVETSKLRGLSKTELLLFQIVHGSVWVFFASHFLFFFFFGEHLESEKRRNLSSK